MLFRSPFDNFDLETSHVLPAFINRFVTAAKNGVQSVTVWGSGKPRREFLHSDDLAKATLIAAEKYDAPDHLNVGTGEDLTIAELAETVASKAGFTGEIIWDSSKPDGTPRKVLDVTNIKKTGWHSEISLQEGIASTIEWFKEIENIPAKRER